MASASSSFVSREEYRAKKALEEARKAGTASAAVDEEGREINPHMPQYITQAPWYLNQGQPSLKHQRARTDQTKTEIYTWYQKGTRGPRVTKFRKGACTNCGAITHDSKTCLERPRKIGAKYSKSNFGRDEIIEDFEFDYDGKRDRWNGYDPASYKVLIEQWEQMEEERKQDPNAEPELEKDKDLIENDDDTITFTNRDPKIKTNTKNLRIREDRAKYLQNLDVNSAHYDGKSRSMRENPTPSLEIKDQDFKGDNYMSHTGFYLDLLEQEKFAIEAEEKAAVEINNVAMPSQAELLYRNFKEKKEVLKSGQKTALLAKYGGEENLGIPDEVAFGETEVYVEYDREGRVLKGTSREKKMKSSRYEEDVHVNGHYCVWGSYFHHHFGWGYKCCYSHKKHSECLREEGKRIEIAREYKLMMDKKKEAEDAHEEMIKKQKIVEGEIESPSKSHSAKQGIENQITNSLAQINSIINQKEGDSNQNQNQHQKDTK